MELGKQVLQPCFREGWVFCSDPCRARLNRNRDNWETETSRAIAWAHVYLSNKDHVGGLTKRKASFLQTVLYRRLCWSSFLEISRTNPSIHKVPYGLDTTDLSLSTPWMPHDRPRHCEKWRSCATLENIERGERRRKAEISTNPRFRDKIYHWKCLGSWWANAE